jgi:hypothetical protein
MRRGTLAGSPVRTALGRPARLRRPLTLGLAVVLALTTPTGAAAEPLRADPGAAESALPAGTTTVIEGAAWSWFEDERVTFAGNGTRLLASAVAGSTGQSAPPGTVLLADVDLASGDRQLVDLGQAEEDDHNSAAIHESASGEITTAWSRHNLDSLVRMLRQRTDGTWLRLPPTDIKRVTTYSNLRSSVDGTGRPVLYDFVRGLRFDPEVIASADSGRTWSRLGRVLRDSADAATRRPYVQYTPSADGRIHFVATDGHPREVQTGVYHGYIEAGSVYNSSGTLLGPLGSAIPVTGLTPVWLPTGVERGWTSDIVVDPSSGRPTVVFSVRTGNDDRRYLYARWSGRAWQVETLAAAGRALYAAEADYTGLVALDAANPSHVVASVDTSPLSGEPLVSAADGQRHWELWDGRRSAAGVWSWTALTVDSTVDNLRPVLVADPGGARAMLWMRGTYRQYTDYSIDVVGVITRADGRRVAAGEPTWATTTPVLPTPTPRPERATPVVGAFDGHPADDLLMVRAGTAPDDLFLGDDQRKATPIAGPSIASSATPVAGDFNGDGRTDIYWYAPGSAIDSLWRSTGSGFASTSTRQYAGTSTPVAGDFDGDGRTDILWYAPNGSTGALWFGRPDGSFDAVTAPRMNANYIPVAGDFDGDGRTDILWYAPGSRAEYRWMAAQGRRFVTTSARQVATTYTPIVADLDGDGADDIQWYAPGPASDQVWWSADGPLAATEAAKVNL